MVLPATQPGTGAAAPSEPATGGDGTPATPLTAEAVSELFKKQLDAWATPFAAKHNAEMAAFRRKIGAGTAAEPTGTGETPKPAAEPKALTLEDLKASREIGKLEAGLPPEALAALVEDGYEDASPQEQARLLRIATKLHKAQSAAQAASPRDADPSRGVTPASTQTSARAAASAVRDAGPTHPRSLSEYAALALKDPKRKAALDADDSFDPSQLPRTLR